MPEPPIRRRPRAVRWLRRVCLATLALEALWCLVALLALQTQFLRQRLNRHPEKLQLDWKNGFSIFPGVFHLTQVAIRGQGRRDQWYADADRIEIRLRLLPLFSRRVVTDSVRLTGVRFRSRPRLDTLETPPADAQDFAPIPGLANPPDLAPSFTDRAAPAHPWSLQLQGIEINDLQEVWIKSVRLAGSGRVQGKVEHELHGPFLTEISPLAFTDASLSYAGTEILTHLTLQSTGRLGPLRFKEDRGTALLRKIQARTFIRGDLRNARFQHHQLHALRAIGLNGDGHLQGDIHLLEGHFQPGSTLDLHSEKLEVRVGELLVSGMTQLGMAIHPGTQGTEASLHLALDALHLRHDEQVTHLAESGALQVRARAFDPHLPPGFQDLTLDVELGPLTLTNTRVLNPFLPEQTGLEFQNGACRIQAAYHRDRTGNGTGRFSLDGDAIDFTLGDRDFQGRLHAASQYRIDAHPVLQLESASILVTNVLVSGVRQRQPDGWHAQIDVDSGSIALDGSRRLQGDVRLDLLDLRPLLALLREDSANAHWARWMPNLKELRGSASVLVEPRHLAFHHLALRAKATEVLAHLTLRDHQPDGILYLRYGLISAGFDFRHGERHWTLLGAKRAYFRALEELGVTPTVVPQDPDSEEPEAAPNPPAPRGTP